MNGLPDIQTQRRIALERYSFEQIAQIAENAKTHLPTVELDIDENDYPSNHLLTKVQGWEAPDPAIVRAYFSQFQKAFNKYGTDKKLAELLGEKHSRRIRAFKTSGKGNVKVPYAVWRKFLIMTGRVVQEIVPVIGIMK